MGPGAGALGHLVDIEQERGAAQWHGAVAVGGLA